MKGAEEVNEDEGDVSDSARSVSNFNQYDEDY